jgi:hypothetical protein
MYNFSMATGITLLNKAAFSAMTLAPSGWKVQVHNLVHLSNNERRWNGMSPQK